MNKDSFRHSLLRIVNTVLAGCAVAMCSAQVSVSTYHNDMARTGLNSHESILTPQNVNPKSFGLLFTLPVDGQVYAQPLYLSNVSIKGWHSHNVVYVATEHNSVYAFDADSNAGANAVPLWHVNLGPSVPSIDTGSPLLVPEQGITSTPVIVNSNPQVLYVVAYTKTLSTSGSPIYAYKLHALDATSGAELLGGPVLIQGSVPGTGDGSVNGTVAFTPLWQLNRAALLYVPFLATARLPAAGAAAPPRRRNLSLAGTIYVAFGSQNDNFPYHGWLFAFDASNLRQIGVFNTGPNSKTSRSGYPVAGAGIWQGGAGPASDGQNIFFCTGNGLFQPSIGAWGDSIVKMKDRVLQVSDYFTPSNQESLNDYDRDLGSGGVLLLPKEASAANGPSLMVQMGKAGTAVLTDPGSLGRYGTTDNVIQELPNVAGVLRGSPAYFNGLLYFGPSYSPLIGVPVQSGKFAANGPIGETTVEFSKGTVPSVSSNGKTNGIVWAIQWNRLLTGDPGALHAFDAGNLAIELYDNTKTKGRDTIPAAIKYSTPTVANGKVYMGTASALAVFGLGSWASAPSFSLPSGRYPKTVILTITDSTPGATIRYTTDGTEPTSTSRIYKWPLTIDTSMTIKAKAFAEGSGASATVAADYLINPAIGDGIGLLGTFRGTGWVAGADHMVSRTDPTIRIGDSGAIEGLKSSSWEGKWTGYLQPEVSGWHRLSVESDDGLEVWINGHLVINNSIDTDDPSKGGKVYLDRGTRVPIAVRWIHNGGNSPLKLMWSGPGLPEETVPTTQLYPARDNGL
ncbi:MAG: chitobiase/beta-hexosaminidase C-terminal domain-containing protein [Fimbriimonas sp.]|nr:chitobiase/beta-hexosaminidase C-terminal domain-containing protein [Fimbriimonas sp.]